MNRCKNTGGSIYGHLPSYMMSALYTGLSQAERGVRYSRVYPREWRRTYVPGGDAEDESASV